MEMYTGAGQSLVPIHATGSSGVGEGLCLSIYLPELELWWNTSPVMMCCACSVPSLCRVVEAW